MNGFARAACSVWWAWAWAGATVVIAAIGCAPGGSRTGAGDGGPGGTGGGAGGRSGGNGGGVGIVDGGRAGSGGGGVGGGFGGYGGGGYGGYGGGGAGGAAGGCLPGDKVCDGNMVRACDGGKPGGPILEACVNGDLCNNGRCTTLECASAEQAGSYFGCEWYTLDSDISFGADTSPFVVAIANPSESVTIDVELQRRMGGAFATVVTGKVTPLGAGFFPVDKDTHVEGTTVGDAIRIRSSGPAAAYHLNAAELSTSDSASSTMLLPSHALGRLYYAMTPPSSPVPGFGLYSDPRTLIGIVATRDGTNISVKATAKLYMPPGSPVIPTGNDFMITLDEGQFVQVATEGKETLTGSEILADKPVSVFSGSSMGFPGGGRYQGDKVEEQIHPAETWGKTFVAADVSFPQNAMNPKNPTVYWTVLSAVDGAEISLMPAAGVTFDGPATFTLNAGQWRTFGAKVPNPTGYADFILTSTQPVQVYHTFGESPSAVVGIPVDQFLPRYVFVAHPYFKDTVTIVRKAGTPVVYDGTTLTDTLFKPINGGFEAARIAIPSCQPDPTKCAHVLTGEKVGIAVAGWHEICGGYAYVAGMDLKCTNIPPKGTAGGNGIVCPL